MAEREITINETTRVSVFTAAQVLYAVIPALFFLAMIYYRGVSSEERIDRHAEAIKTMRQDLIDIKVSLARIEGALGAASEKKKR